MDVFVALAEEPTPVSVKRYKIETINVQIGLEVLFKRDQWATCRAFDDRPVSAGKLGC